MAGYFPDKARPLSRAAGNEILATAGPEPAENKMQLSCAADVMTLAGVII
jgi:hypothetical protein